MKKKQNYKQKLVTDLHDQVDEFDETISEVVNDLTPSQRVAIELAIQRLKEDLKMVAENVDPPVDEMMNNTEFKNDFIAALDGDTLSQAAYEANQGVVGSYTVIKSESLAEQIVVEQFLEKYYANPYQLNLLT